MVKVLSQELAASHLTIRVNGIAPGLITTKFSKIVSYFEMSFLIFYIMISQCVENKMLYEEFLKMVHLKR